MVKRCIAAGCSNTYKENVSLFTFPRDSVLRECWTRQVRRTRVDWSRPKATSYLFSDHFMEDCLIETSLITAKFGIKMRRTLRPDAVLTIFKRKVAQGAAPPSSKKRVVSCSTEPGYSQAMKKTRPAFEKQERARVRQGINKPLVTATIKL